MRTRVATLLALLATACARTPPPVVPPEPPVSVLLITIDTLRADRLGAYGDAAARTPVLDGIARAGAVFERAYTPVPITLPAHASLMTGLLPPGHGVRGNGSFALGTTEPTLAEAMKAAGRETGAFIAGFPLVRRFGLARGFDVYDDTLVRADGVHYEFAERPARDVVNAAAGWLARRKGAVFAWVHLFDPHAPYAAPPAFRTGDAYRDEVAAVDDALASLMAAWDARPGRSLVVVTSDHGEAFGEHGEWSHSLFVYDTTLHVPLLVRGPGFAPGSRASTRVSLTDVAATILEVAQVKAKLPGASLRRALAAGAPDRPLYAETLAPRLDFGWSELRSWREGGYKWIRAPRPEVYALDDDVAETRNLAVQERARGRAMDDALSAAIEATGDRMATRRPDAESKERLRSLGYVQGPGGRGSGADPKDKVELARRIAESTGPFRDWDDMIGTYRTLVAMDRANPLLNLRLADALLRAGKPQEALAPFGRVVASGPQNADAHVGYATALAQLGRVQEARRFLEQALEIDPSSGQAHYNLAEIARAEGRLGDARREYAAAKSDPVTADRAEARLQELR
jgi:choline-sulfatase